MLIPYSVTQGYSILRKALTDQALVDLDQLMRSVADEPPAVQREALMDLLPALGDQYASATGEVAAVFSGELMELQGVKNPVAPETLALPEPGIWHALVGYGTTDRVLERGGALLMYSLLSGGLTKRLTEFAADTMIGNGTIQSVSTSAARVPKPGCCTSVGCWRVVVLFILLSLLVLLAGAVCLLVRVRGGARSARARVSALVDLVPLANLSTTHAVVRLSF